MESKSMFRVAKNKDNPYVMLNKEFFNDERLSWKAKGILGYLLSLPDDWKIYEEELKKHSKDGIDGLRSGIKELIKNGYIERVRIRDEKGRLKGYEYSVYEIPNHIGISKNGFSKIGESNTTNNNLTNNDLTNNTCSSSDGLLKEFEGNICNLKKTTKIKFQEIVKTYDSDFILSILEQCSISNIKSYAGFQKVFDSYINRSCATREDVEKATEEYRVNHTKKETKAYSKPNKTKKTNHSNFEPREIYSDEKAMKEIEDKLTESSTSDDNTDVSELLKQFNSEN
jgi:hypothetical protein